MIRRVLLQKSEHRAKYNVFVWHIKFLDTGKNMRLVIPQEDLATMLAEKIGSRVAIPLPFILQFCSLRTGKEINLDMTAELNDIPLDDMRKMSDGQLNGLVKNVSKFPFAATMSMLREEDGMTGEEKDEPMAFYSFPTKENGGIVND